MGVAPTATAIAAEAPATVQAQLARWAEAVDEVVVRALPGEDTVEATLALARAAAPGALLDRT
jgi:hypothetical protein